MLTFLLAKLEELLGYDTANEMLPPIQLTAPAVPVAEESSRVRRVTSLGQRLERRMEHCT